MDRIWWKVINSINSYLRFPRNNISHPWVPLTTTSPSKFRVLRHSVPHYLWITSTTKVTSLKFFKAKILQISSMGTTCLATKSIRSLTILILAPAAQEKSHPKSKWSLRDPIKETLPLTILGFLVGTQLWSPTTGWVILCPGTRVMKAPLPRALPPDIPEDL